jgi:predicted nucleotidyltransferase component of viral defense system
MILHKYIDEFEELIKHTSQFKNISENAIKRDYLIVLLLQKLSSSSYRDSCVFKGGTSLSKCFPGVIERFSEDIDLTYIPYSGSSIKIIENNLKEIEKVLSIGLKNEKIDGERNISNKSSFIWIDNKTEGIKLEIGSSVVPEPYSVKGLKTYIQEFLEKNNFSDEIEKFGLSEVFLNVLDISRTFIDKVMAVKRHANCGSLSKKVRHIYDVVKLYDSIEVKDFINDLEELMFMLK